VKGLEVDLGKWQRVAWLKFVLGRGLWSPSKTRNPVMLTKTRSLGYVRVKEDDLEWEKRLM
jgi:hypothetical protein